MAHCVIANGHRARPLNSVVRWLRVSEQPSNTSETLRVILGVVGIFVGVVALMIAHLLPGHFPMWVQVTLGAAGWAIFLWNVIARRSRDRSGDLPTQ